MKVNFAFALLIVSLPAAMPARADFNGKLAGLWIQASNEGRLKVLVEKGRISIFKDIKGWYQAGYRLKAVFKQHQIVRTLYSGKSHTLNYTLQGHNLTLSAEGRKLNFTKFRDPKSEKLKQQLNRKWRLIGGNKRERGATFDGRKIIFPNETRNKSKRSRIASEFKQQFGRLLVFNILNMSKGRIGLIFARIKDNNLVFYRYRNDNDPVAVFQRQK